MHECKAPINHPTDFSQDSESRSVQFCISRHPSWCQVRALSIWLASSQISKLETCLQKSLSFPVDKLPGAKPKPLTYKFRKFSWLADSFYTSSVWWRPGPSMLTFERANLLIGHVIRKKRVRFLPLMKWLCRFLGFFWVFFFFSHIFKVYKTVSDLDWCLGVD